MPPKDKGPRRARLQKNRLEEPPKDENKRDAGSKPNAEEVVSKAGYLPFPYRRYHPTEQIEVTDRRVHFWFYVYIYSSEVDRLMAPFLQMDQRFAKDRRLLAIMNKSGVRVSTGGLELYKSLPRRIVIMQAASWNCIVRAIFEMEDLLPELMRYACYPILMDHTTQLFNCTSFRQTAGIVRVTDPFK